VTVSEIAFLFPPHFPWRKACMPTFGAYRIYLAVLTMSAHRARTFRNGLRMTFQPGKTDLHMLIEEFSEFSAHSNVGRRWSSRMQGCHRNPCAGWKMCGSWRVHRAFCIIPNQEARELFRIMLSQFVRKPISTSSSRPVRIVI
jgi:hypothetical protein